MVEAHAQVEKGTNEDEDRHAVLGQSSLTTDGQDNGHADLLYQYACAPLACHVSMPVSADKQLAEAESHMRRLRARVYRAESSSR